VSQHDRTEEKTLMDTLKELGQKYGVKVTMVRSAESEQLESSVQ
jgi:hypothetical protein